jgi:hypothetical protein
MAMAKTVGHCRVTLVFDISRRRFAGTRASWLVDRLV